MWFQKKRQTLPTEPTSYPSGTFLKTEKGAFYIAGKDKRFRITTNRVLESWSPARVVQTTEMAVKHYRVAARLKFRNGSLIHSIADGKVYLIVDSKRCQVTSPDVYERIGAVGGRKDVTSVSLDEINLHELGEDIT